jgi:RNA polymerase sigma-70 factor, ECF subfamily
VISWNTFVEEKGPLVYRTALRITGQSADAEDIVQDVFLEVYRLWQNRKVGNWDAVLRSLATRRSLDLLRRRKHSVTIGEVIADTSASPDVGAIRTELQDALRQAIARLPEQQAIVFALHYLEDQSHQEISAMLEITPQAVAVALHKARRRLQGDLAPILSGKDEQP